MNEAAVGRPCYNPLMARGRGVSKMTWGADDGVDVRVGFHVWVGWGGGVYGCVRARLNTRESTCMCMYTHIEAHTHIHMYTHMH